MWIVVLGVVAQFLLRVRATTPLEYADLDHPPTLEPVEDTIRYVFAIARGGIRAPIFDPYPTDPAGKDFKGYWGVDKGELLESGRRLMKALGRSLYSRYIRFLELQPNPARRLLSASSGGRTADSAILVGAELFQNRFTNASAPNVLKQVDKYEMISELERPLCSRYTRERTRTHAWRLLHDDVTVPDDDNDLHPRVAEVQQLTGVRGSLTRLDLMKMWDTLYMRRATGREVPAWAEDLLAWRDLTDETYDFVTGGDRYLTDNFTVGPLFHQLLQELQGAREDVGFHFHVTHSLFLSAVLGSLGLNMFKAHVGTTLLLELHQDDMVRVLIYQPLDWENPGVLHEAKGRSPLVTALEGLCHDWDFLTNLAIFTCPLNKFKAKLPNLSPLEWEKNCQQVS